MSKLFAGSLGKTTEILRNLEGEGKGQFVELSSNSSLSGDLEVYQHDISVLSGDFTQTGDFNHSQGTFKINPTNGKDGFYIGTESFKACLYKYGGKEALKNKTFDLGTGQGTMDALSSIITALGGKFTVPAM